MLGFCKTSTATELLIKLNKKIIDPSNFRLYSYILSFFSWTTFCNLIQYIWSNYILYFRFMLSFMFLSYADFNAKHLVQFSIYPSILLTILLLFSIWNILLYHSDTCKTKYNLREGFCKLVEALEYSIYWYRKVLLKDHSALSFYKNQTFKYSLLFRLLVSE